jgi:hypothetical protein
VIPACRLWEKTSAKGNRYLIGRLGGVRVMVLQNTRPEPGDTPTHTLMFAEAPAYDGARGQAAPAEAQQHDGPPNDVEQAEPSEPPSTSRRRARRGEDKQPVEDDPVPF